MIRFHICLVYIILTGISGANAEKTKNFRGHEAIFVNQKAITQADGSTTQLIEAPAIMFVTEGDSAPATVAGNCWGMGTVSKAGTYSGRLQCSYTWNEKDSYSIRIDDDSMKGGTFVITGGTGAFANATGKGSYTYTWGNAINGNKLATDFETTIVVP